MKSLALILLSAGAIAAAWFLLEPMPQNPDYHKFVDSAAMYGIPNFWNTSSNGLIILVGLLGIFTSTSMSDAHVYVRLRRQFGVLFTAAVLTGAGSIWYHLDPSNTSLAWDRLPMSLIFTALLSIVISIYISRSAGKILFLPLLFAGVASALYWYKSEQLGAGDLRFYALSQYLSAFLILAIILLYRGLQRPTTALVMALVFYTAAKASEYYDAVIYDYTSVISGHSLKHLFAGLALFMVYLILRRKHAYSADE
jgi:hypothetical protein